MKTCSLCGYKFKKTDVQVFATANEYLCADCDIKWLRKYSYCDLVFNFIKNKEKINTRDNVIYKLLLEKYGIKLE